MTIMQFGMTWIIAGLTLALTFRLITLLYRAVHGNQYGVCKKVWHDGLKLAAIPFSVGVIICAAAWIKDLL